MKGYPQVDALLYDEARSYPAGEPASVGLKAETVLDVQI
jgi:hypothetical protein